jgi:hypothetical protein
MPVPNPSSTAAVYLDDLVRMLASPVNVDKLNLALRDAMDTGKVLEVKILNTKGETVTALLKPANARIAFAREIASDQFNPPPIGKPPV